MSETDIQILCALAQIEAAVLNAYTAHWQGCQSGNGMSSDPDIRMPGTVWAALVEEASKRGLIKP